MTRALFAFTAERFTSLAAAPSRLYSAPMKEAYIAAKERWARKMAGKEKPAVRSENRLPPCQRQVHNFPVLDLGIRPDVALDKWELKIHGLVENPVTLNWEQFKALPQFKDEKGSSTLTQGSSCGRSQGWFREAADEVTRRTVARTSQGNSAYP